MKKQIISVCIFLSAMTLLTGCVASLNFGGGKKTSTTNSDQHPAIGEQTVAPTVGQQLIDLQKAKDAGAITDAEYQAEKAKILGTQ